MINPLVIQFRSTYKYLVNYSYLVVDRVTREAILIDCSWEHEKICEYIENQNIQLKMIFLTHSHFDHITSVEQMVQRYRADVYMSNKEIDYYQYRCSNLNGFEDLQEIRIADMTIKFIVTPGHTKGSACFEIEQNLFSGDTVFYEGCGVCIGDGADPEAMYDSFQKIRQLITGTHKLYSAHSFGQSPGIMMRDVYRDNIYFNLNEKSSFVRFRMRPNQNNITDFY